MTSAVTVVRDARPDDVPAIVALAARVDQDHEWAGGDPAYVEHLLAAGRVVVAEGPDGPLGYAATRSLASGTRRWSMLCDLFVASDAHGRGHGRAMLSKLWRDEPHRMTFSSTHPSALPLYTSFGLSAWWPLLYLQGDPARLEVATGWAVEQVDAPAAAALEESWTGVRRAADHRAWAARPGAVTFEVRAGGRAVAVGVAGGAPGGFALEHLRIDPACGAADCAVTAALAWLGSGPGTTAYLPAPHPAVAPLLAAGWRVTDYDLFMATDPLALDPRRDLPSPALA